MPGMPKSTYQNGTSVNPKPAAGSRPQPRHHATPPSAAHSSSLASRPSPPQLAAAPKTPSVHSPPAAPMYPINYLAAAYQPPAQASPSAGASHKSFQQATQSGHPRPMLYDVHGMIAPSGTTAAGGPSPRLSSFSRGLEGMSSPRSLFGPDPAGFLEKRAPPPGFVTLPAPSQDEVSAAANDASDERRLEMSMSAIANQMSASILDW